MIQATQLDAYNLMHDGAIALAQVEANGIRIDVDYLERTQVEVKEQIRELRRQLQSHEVYKLQLKRFGQKTNLTSRPQLAKVLTKDMGLKLGLTERSQQNEDGPNRYKMDNTALDSLDLDYCRMFIRMEKLNKLSGTYLNGVAKEVVDGWLRPVENLHLAKSYRSSIDSPSFQNIPIRDPVVAKYIRSGFIPRGDDYVLLEIDYGSHEFRMGACHYEDPAMVAYASDPTKDIHRDCAAQIYKIKTSEVSKHARYCAKNKFVFPELYGDFYIACAQNCWEGIDGLKLMAGDMPMKDHLKQQGITKLGRCDSNERPDPNTFEWHMKNFEHTFYQWFPVLKEGRDRLWNDYKKNGFIQLLTGFVISGVWKRNFILNVVIQGPSFHLLLWSLIQLVKRERRYKTKSKVIGQIHDSIIMDVHRSELDDTLVAAKDIMTVQTKNHFPWVITPLEIEAEVAETNWFEKKAIAI